MQLITRKSAVLVFAGKSMIATLQPKLQFTLYSSWWYLQAVTLLDFPKKYFCTEQTSWLLKKMVETFFFCFKTYPYYFSHLNIKNAMQCRH